MYFVLLIFRTRREIAFQNTPSIIAYSGKSEKNKHRSSSSVQTVEENKKKVTRNALKWKDDGQKEETMNKKLSSFLSLWRQAEEEEVEATHNSNKKNGEQKE